MKGQSLNTCGTPHLNFLTMMFLMEGKNIKGENLHHDHMLITVNIFSIKGK